MYLLNICLYCYGGKGPSILYTGILGSAMAKSVSKGSSVRRSLFSCTFNITLDVCGDTQKQRGEKWEFFFTEETQLLRTERKTESENRSYITTNMIFDLERDHQGRLKL